MRITIAAIGKLKDAPERDLCRRYADRIDAASRSLALGPLEVIEMPEGRAAGAKQRMADEGRRLSEATAGVDWRIALDVKGRQLSSEAFARLLGERRDGGTGEAAFLVGGPDGHGEAVRSGAGLILSLGPMTLPHGLARVVLLEQIYRAITIIAGHPYHRG